MSNNAFGMALIAVLVLFNWLILLTACAVGRCPF